ncbi:MAG TPA: sigma-54 dependent transcriptional regulator [Spirochaetales bacterium]|nr:sigma-54 dependent transcriptional regulator [Spirochaetales bacterium]
MKTLLIVDADRAAGAVARAVLAGSYSVYERAALDDALAFLSIDHVDLVLLDLAEPTLKGHANAVASVLASPCRPRVVGAADQPRPSLIVGAVKAGALSFVGKPYVAEDLVKAVREAAVALVAGVGDAGLAGESARYSVARPETKKDASRLLGSSPIMNSIRGSIRRFASCDEAVLILGETGTGKELAAQEIHARSSRKDKPFMPVDCAALPESLAESELFGTVKGAFTGSVSRMGLFEAAKGGTLFLDEVGELPLPVQAKLLRTLESRCGCRVGSVEQIRYDVRVVSATNAPVYEDPSRFRPELLNRLNTLVLKMPPLRARPEDIGELARQFLAGLDGRKSLHDDAIRSMEAWHWPGNVRELRNVIHRAAILSPESATIRAADIETQLGSSWGSMQRRLC